MREIRPSSSRAVTRGDRVTTWHSFSYGAYYDPENIRFGPVQAINVEHVAPGAGYPLHHHADVEIVTWVLDGTLCHRDSTGAGGIISAGTAQRLSAGHGVEHTETNASATEPLVFVQMMIASDHDGEPGYAQADVRADAGVLLPTVDVAASAELRLARFAGGERIDVPPAPRRLVHVTQGAVTISGAVLAPGDELRTDEQDQLQLTADTNAEALVWLLTA